jgi:hypothetical protein
VIYYAHSIAIYNTPQEDRDMELFKSLGLKVYNPNNPCDAEAYRRVGMGHFDNLLREAIPLGKFIGLAFRANIDGSINAGIAREVETARELGAPIIELPSNISRRTLDVETTRGILREQGVR